MMSLAEALIAGAAEHVHGNTVVEYQGATVDLTPPWRRVTMADLVRETSGIDFGAIDADDADALAAARAAAAAAGVANAEEAPSAGKLLAMCFDDLCEESLIQPTFVTEYPIEISPLAKPHRAKAGVTECALPPLPTPHARGALIPSS